jgi:hypothetical protein
LFKEATREQNRLRMCLCGPPGSGKTYTALRFAFALSRDRDGGRGGVAVIDTENHSATKYTGEAPDGIPWKFAHLDLKYHAPDSYRAAIEEAGRAGFDCLLIDSLSHAWAGIGGALDQVDRNDSANRFTAWKEVTPQHNALVSSMISSPCHIIATMRSKVEYVLEVNEKGKNVPRKVGLKPIQREGVEYEFDVIADLDTDHFMTVSKSRCPLVDGMKVFKPDSGWMMPVYHWLMSGSPPPSPIPALSGGPAQPDKNGGGILLEAPPPSRAAADPILVAEIRDAAIALGWAPERLREVLWRAGVGRIADLELAAAYELRKALHAKVDAAQAAEAFGGSDAARKAAWVSGFTAGEGATAALAAAIEAPEVAPVAAAAEAFPDSAPAVEGGGAPGDPPAASGEIQK